VLNKACFVEMHKCMKNNASPLQTPIS